MLIGTHANAGVLLWRPGRLHASSSSNIWTVNNVCIKRFQTVRSRSLKDDADGKVQSVRSGDVEGLSRPSTPNPKASDLECFGTGIDAKCVVPESKTVKKGSDARTDAPGNKRPSLASVVLDSILLISPFFFWGTSMVAMKEVSPHTTPLFVAAWRLIPAGVALLGWAAIEKRKQPQSAMAWLAIALFGLADGTCFQGFLAEGLQRTSAGLGSVIIDSQPLTVAVLASIFFGEKLGLWGIVGLFVGILGLLMLELPPSYFSTIPFAYKIGTTDIANLLSGQISGQIWDSGEWWMLLAAQSMAVGTVMVRWVAKYCDPIVATGWHMILGGVPLVLLAAVQDQGILPDKLSLLTINDAFLLVFVSLFGSAASYGVFFYEATVRGNLTSLSSLTFLTPMFAAIAGYFALGETLSPFQLAGATVTLGAVALISSSTSKSGESSEKEG